MWVFNPFYFILFAVKHEITNNDWINAFYKYQFFYWVCMRKYVVVNCVVTIAMSIKRLSNIFFEVNFYFVKKEKTSSSRRGVSQCV